MLLGPSVLCLAPCLEPGLVPPNREGRGSRECTRLRMIQCSHWGSMEEMSWAKDRSPALNPYKHHVPAPRHSCIPAALMSTSSILPWPAPPFLATGASADLTAALSCYDAWLAVAAACISQQECCEHRQQAMAQQNCDTPHLAHGSAGAWLHPMGREGRGARLQGLVSSATRLHSLCSWMKGTVLLRPHANVIHSLEWFWKRPSLCCSPA